MGVIVVLLLQGWWLLARCWDWEGGREVIGLQVAPAGTEDPEEKLEVCHLTGGDPSVLKPSPSLPWSTTSSHWDIHLHLG